jgi:hypothetical protein
LIPEFAPAIHNKVKTIGARGADNIEVYFDDFLRLFVFINGNRIYHKKAWVMADGDEAGRKNIEKLRLKFTDWPEENFICFSKNNFEEFYPPQFKAKFESIKEISDKRKRFEEKGVLTKSVIDWINANREMAKVQFAESASEIIEILQNIARSIV